MIRGKKKENVRNITTSPRKLSVLTVTWGKSFVTVRTTFLRYPIHTPRRAIFQAEEKHRQAAYEYQKLAFMRGRVRRQRSTLSTGLFSNCGISFRGWSTQILFGKHTVAYVVYTAFSSSLSLLTKRSARYKKRYKKKFREKLDANISWTLD